MKRFQRRYPRHRALVDRVWTLFKTSLTRPLISRLSRETGIPDRTLRDWYKRYQAMPDWRPYDTSVHGEHLRIFTDEEENALVEFIVDNFFKPGLAFHDSDFQFLAMSAFLEKYRDRDCPDFQCSPGFIADFKKRNHLSTRKAHFKRRPVSLPDTEAWIAHIRELLDNVPHERVVNCDETAWRILPCGCTTWAKKGSDNIVVTTKDDEKEAITVLASITASGTKLPLLIIAKGRTTRAEASQLGDIDHHYSFHTETGWINKEAFERYLMILREQFEGDDTIYLLLDIYPAHRVESVKNLAAELNIHLVYVPAGLTDKFQPLDRRIFGALKASAKAQVYQFMSQNPGQRIGRLRAVQYLITSWKNLSQDAINSSWSIYLE